ncbi:hypothetical protein FOZ60_010082 [Perkinsus olseni]|uniref:Reverse transcriptase domain-containing protein n=1 Tax=Perkinsus olseni TaxID=32597 RepID=A0A7J6NFY0_PEROL|nr:hypothetical protein FOZ60_010082 [Perkinsus olseni]
MVPGERSVEGRRKNRARYRAKRARAAETDRPIPPLPVASFAGSPQHDDVGGSSTLHSWEANTPDVFASFPPESIPPVDGTGFPDLSQWDGDISFSPRYEKLSLALAKAVRAKAEAWVRRPEVRNFLLRYEQASRLEQTEMANKWVALGIERESEQLAATLARLLESAGLGSSETLLQSASPISPIRGRLLEAVARVTWPGEGPEDCGIAAVAMSGMPLGLSLPIPEDLRTWPAYREQPLRPWEPEVIRWTGLSVSDLPPRPQVDDSAMARLLDEQIKRELETGKMISMNRSTFREIGGLGISKANVIWKDAAHSKIRIISNYRTSGVNHASRMLTTTLYPGLPQIRLLLREVGPGSALAEFDVTSAFRTLQPHPLEHRFLALRDSPPPIAGIRNVTADVISRSARASVLASAPSGWTHLSGTCYIVLTAARSIIIICYAASDVVLLGLAGRNSIEWDCGSCTGSSVFDAQEVSTSFSFARVYAAETAATPEDRARANSRLLEYSLKPRTMASYQTPLRFYEMGFGGSLGAGRSLLAQYGSILRRCERWVWFELARASHQKGEALISRALASADRILLDKDQPKKQAAPLCQECLQSLADMQLTPGGFA